MMEDMIERVARAISPDFLWNEKNPALALLDKEAVQRERKAYRLRAKSAIEAMREPTQRMLDEVTSSEGIEPWTDKIMGDTYRSMIDAALVEGP